MLFQFIKSLIVFSILLSAEKQEVNQSTFFSTTEVLPEPGLELLKKHCYVCHNPNTSSHDEIIAPPLAGIKSHYTKAYPEKEKFKKAMTEFVTNPNQEKALMKGPVNRFGLMPKPATASPEEIQLIVDYIQSNELEKPVWYDQHHQKKN